jgi:hypothetical protein
VYTKSTSFVLQHSAMILHNCPFAYVPGARCFAAGYELLYRLSKAYEKPGFDIREVEQDGRNVPVVEQVVLEKAFLPPTALCTEGGPCWRHRSAPAEKARGAGLRPARRSPCRPAITYL